jgi:hypothetical protein
MGELLVSGFKVYVLAVTAWGAFFAEAMYQDQKAQREAMVKQRRDKIRLVK